jgi:hypothetical protein
MSKNHKILYNKKMVKAKELLGLNDKVKKVDYEGETLYNVLMEDYNKMLVNNLICETLEPNHDIAKLYKYFQGVNIEEQQKMIKHYNNEYKKRNNIVSK